MASNKIKGQEAIEDLTRKYDLLAISIDEASLETKQFIQTTQKVPSEYTAAIEKLKKAHEGQTRAIEKTTHSQELYEAKIKEEKRIANELNKTKAKLSSIYSKENKQLNSCWIF